jgi:hypothetical protein
MITAPGKSKIWITLFVATLLGWLVIPIAPVQANPMLAELERKIADLTLLHQQLGDRMAQAQAIRAALNEQQTELTSEIRVLVKKHNVETLQHAGPHLRLRYNIELLRTILTYMDELDDKIQSYQSGRERLSYLRGLAEDDIRMIAALNNLKIDALTTQISLVINRYLPEAHIIQIDPQRVHPISAQEVWDRWVENN